ncbi:MAG: Ig-like domain-containing protein [Gammaproteobacteria bacterium]
MNSSDTEIGTQGFPYHSRTNIKGFLKFAPILLCAGVSTAQAALLDHGPSDPLLVWPQWYRDTNGLALGICTSQELSPNPAAGPGATMCFPPVPDPAGFDGNIGEEAFYNMVEFRDTATGSDFRFRYVAALEASYLPLGVPVHGTELVFARVRIALNFNDTAKNGTYVVTHPFGVEVFNNVEATNNSNLFGANAAVFFTADVPLGPEMNFDGALDGALGPFIQWDVLEPGESLTVNGTTFLGDPNYDHTFTGSPYGTNYIRIDGPVGSNLDGLGHDFIQLNAAAVLGQVWGSPIAQPLSIDGTAKSTYIDGVNSIDVWATSSPNQRLILTGSGMPSLELLPDGVVPGKYHGHVEYPSSQPVPASIMVTNVDSNPVISKSTLLSDSVEISQATYDTLSGDIVIIAHSSDLVAAPDLVVRGIPGVPSAFGVLPAVTGLLTADQCPTGTVTATGTVCFVHTLPAGIEPPQRISVISSELGRHGDALVAIVGNPQNLPNPPVANNFTGINGFTVATGGPSFLINSTGGTLPTNALIISPADTGNVELIGADWVYTPNPVVVAGPDRFQFVLQDPTTGAVSNVAFADLTLEFQASPPTANPDQFAAQASSTPVTTTINVLGNDTAASTNPADQIDPSTVIITSQPILGTAQVNPDGTIAYMATGGGGDSLRYVVSNSANPAMASNETTLQLTNFTGPESNSVGKVNYTPNQSKWVIVGSTNWFGPNLSQSKATCWLGTPDTTPTPSTLIGSVLIDTTGKYQLQIVDPNAPVATNNARVSCQTSYGGIGSNTATVK